MMTFGIMVHQKNLCFVFSGANSCACKLAPQSLRVLTYISWIKPLIDGLLVFLRVVVLSFLSLLFFLFGSIGFYILCSL